MKAILVSLMSLASASAFAAGAEKYVCNEFDPANDKLLQHTIVLTPEQAGDLEEEVPFKYSLKIYSGSEIQETLESDGNLVLEDVRLEFNSTDGKKANFVVYLDEGMKDGKLKIGNKKMGDFVCR